MLNKKNGKEKNTDINSNNLEKDIETIEKFLGNNTWEYIDLDYWEGTKMSPTDELAKSIKHLLSDYTRQKQINEEH